MMQPTALILTSIWLECARAAAAVLPISDNILWYEHPGDVWSKTWLPVGNGYLAGASRNCDCELVTELDSDAPGRHRSRDDSAEH